MPDCVKAADSWQRFGNKTSESPGEENNTNNYNCPRDDMSEMPISSFYLQNDWR